MAFTVSFNGVTYVLPSPGDNNAWAIGPNSNGLNAFLTALSTSTYQPNTGSGLPLTATLDFGGSFGIKALSVTSETANPAASGVVRLAHADTVSFRNAANNADVALGTGSANQLQWNGADVTGNPAAIYNTASNTFTTGTTTIVNFATIELDTNNAVTTGASWVFTVPSGKAGVYSITAQVTPNAAVSASVTQLLLYKNGALARDLWTSSGAIPSTTSIQGSTEINLAAADTISVKLAQASGGTITLTNSAFQNWIAIVRNPP